MSGFIQKVFTSRDNNANSANYVGEQDRLWWNPDTNALYYSDGNTPGGQPVGIAGNASIGGSNTQIQYNSTGSFAGSYQLTYDFTNNVLYTPPTITNGNFVPSTPSTFSLGTPTNKWGNMYLGPNAIFIQDIANVNNSAELNVLNNILYIGNVAGISTGAITNGNSGMFITPNGSVQFSTTGISNVLVLTNTGSNFAGPANIGGNLQIAGGLTANGTSILIGNVTMSGNATVLGNLNANGLVSLSNIVLMSGEVGISGNLTANGTSNLVGNVIMGGTVQSIGNFIANGTTNLSGNVLLQNNIQVTGTLTATGTSNLVGNVIMSGTVQSIGNFTANGTSNLVGNVIMGGTVQSIGNFTANGTSSLIGTVGISGNATVNGSLRIGNILLSSDQIYDIVANNSLTIATTGTNAGIIFNTNEFNIYTTTNPKPSFQVNGIGEVQILTPTFDSNTGAVSIIGSSDGNYVPPASSGSMLHITGQPGTASKIHNDAANNYSLFVGRRYDGTSSSPTPVNSNELVARFAGSAYNSANVFPAAGIARFDIVASENQTATNQGARIEVWTTPIGSNVISKQLVFSSNGVTFNDGTSQNTAAIPLSYIGVGNGVASLNSSGKVPTSQLPAGAVIYIGAWNASTNTPTLGPGLPVGVIAGWQYSVSAGGTQDIGEGSTTFYAGDYVIYNGTAWDRIPGSGSVVASFNTRTGAVTLQSSDVTTALGYTPYNGATNPNGYVNSSQAAAAAPVQSFNTRTGTVTLQSSDVTTALTSGSLTNAKLANSNIIIGNTTISLGSTANALAGLAAVTATTFTGNLTGAATTAGTVTTGAQPNITSVGNLTTLAVTGNLSAGNLSGAGAGLSAINGANVTGTVANATYATSAGFATLAATANTVAGANVTGNVPNALNAFNSTYASVANSVTGANVIGIVANATYASSAGTASSATSATTAGTVTTNAQPNITSVGNLTSLAVTGNANVGNLGTSGLIVATSNITGGNLTTVGIANVGTLAVTGNATVTGNTTTSNLNISANGVITTPRIAFNDGGVRSVTGGTTQTINFNSDSIVLWYVPTGDTTVTLANFTAGSTVKLIVRMGGNGRNIAMGVSDANNSTTGTTTITGHGPGALYGANQAVILTYSCVDGTAANTYVQASYV